MVETLTEFYTVHYNLGIVAGVFLLIALWRIYKTDVKGFLTFICLCVVYNIVIFKKTERNPNWYDEIETKVKNYDPVDELWNEKQNKKPKENIN